MLLLILDLLFFRHDPYGRTYYVDHTTKSTTWERPSNRPLPAGYHIFIFGFFVLSSHNLFHVILWSKILDFDISFGFDSFQIPHSTFFLNFNKFIKDRLRNSINLCVFGIVF